MSSLSIVKTLVVLFYVGHFSSWALKLPPTAGVSLSRNARQLVTCPGFAGYCSESYPGDTCTVVCAFGRNNVPECQPDGTWSDNPRCIEHEPGLEEQTPGLCPGVPGYCSDSPTGTLCEFDCLIGPDIRSVCKPDGTWGPYPTCDGDIRETRDGCDDCPGPFGGPRDRKKENGNGNGGNRRSGGSKNSGNGSRRNNNRKNGNGGGNRKSGNGGGGKTQAEELAEKAGAIVPGKLPQGRRPPKPDNFKDLIDQNLRRSGGSNNQRKNNNTTRKNGNGGGKRQRPRSISNGSKRNNNGSNGARRKNNGSRNNQASPRRNNNKGSKRNQNNKNGRQGNNRKQNNNKNGRQGNNRKQNRNNFGQKNKGSTNQKPKASANAGGGSVTDIGREKVEALAVATGAIVPGKQPNGRLPPRTPGDEEKIARRLGQASSTKDNGNRPQTNTQKQKQPAQQRNGNTTSGNGSGCSESELEACISICPSSIFSACVDGCAQRC